MPFSGSVRDTASSKTPDLPRGVRALLSDVADLLLCPVCGRGLRRGQRSLRCDARHTFDVARQGYVNLLAGQAPAGTADTADMVRAREEFLAAGHYRILADALTAETRRVRAGSGLVVDVGAGTGHYLARVLDGAPGASGLAIDVSKHALRRAARAHPRAAAIAWDVWQPFPVRSGVAAVVLDVFAPRHGAEFRRVLRPDGALLVVTPEADHLGELVGPLGLVAVDERKDERLDTALDDHFRIERRERIAGTAVMSPEQVVTVASMGPSARHVAPEDLRGRATALGDRIPVSVAFRLAVYRPR
jgi:SAM-dependent methyltransferase